MVAYGVPVIHQSLATAPLDVKEAIDWLIRIGGKDINDSKKNRASELLKTARRALQEEMAPRVDWAEQGIVAMDSTVQSLLKELCDFIGYDTGYDTGVVHRLRGSGIGRRTGQSILKDIIAEKFLECCIDDSNKCTPKCKCCIKEKTASSYCNPQKCPIRALLECVIVQSVLCYEDANAPSNTNSKSKMCCILSFLMVCFVEGEELVNGSVSCKRCGSSELHGICHKECKCVHKEVTSKVACRINCLIQLGRTLEVLYVNKGVPMCQTCSNCKICNSAKAATKCEPCSDCTSGYHCDKCWMGECCEENQQLNTQCQNQCQRCLTCSTVRGATVFWRAHDRLTHCCSLCAYCNEGIHAYHEPNCETCMACYVRPCSDMCKHRRWFAGLISELLHFIVYNFSYVAYAATWKIASIKKECCQEKGKAVVCKCKSRCCDQCEYARSPCKACESYCICCVDQGNRCSCSNDCADKLELALRPALHGYVSAYDYETATWENLCKRNNSGENCSDQCTDACQCGSNDCPQDGCCTHCPKRMCAKTFFVVVPSIYRFLDYVKGHITDELNGSISNSESQWAAALITGDTHLGELFRTCGFQSSRLQLRMGCEMMKNNHDTNSGVCMFRDHQPGNLMDLHESFQKANEHVRTALMLSNINSGTRMNSKKPSTVRDKLLWLCGLPYSDEYGHLQRRFKESMPNGISNLAIMELALSLGVFPFHMLEDSSHCIWEYITRGFNVPNSKHRLDYNPDPVRLLWDLYDAMYDVTCALTFMNKQCHVSSINSGWEECKFGRNVCIAGYTNDGRCNCQRGTCNLGCRHCKYVCNACRGDAKCVCCCPYCEQRPDNCLCLVRFITDNGSMTNPSHTSPFFNTKYGHMGFRKDSLRMEMRGSALYECMSSLLTKDCAVFPRLLEYLIIARAGLPENLSDCFALFWSLGRRLELEHHDAVMRPKVLAVVVKSTISNTFICAHDTMIDHVVVAVRRLYNKNAASTHAAYSSSSGNTRESSDFRSLNGCDSDFGRVGYMFAMPLMAYELHSTHFCDVNMTSAQLFTRWIFCGASSFYSLMRSFTEQVNVLECCKEPGRCTCESSLRDICVCDDGCNCACVNSGRNCKCGTITRCKEVLPLLYRNGLTFHEPDAWSYPKRRCKSFSETLNRFIGPDSMLCRLIEAIENFLWHIRMPFCIAFLTLWCTALCFLICVVIGYMDGLGIRSRWLPLKQLTHPLQLFTSSMVKPMGGGTGAVI